MTSQEIRQAYIDFFVRKHGHTFVPSSPVVPHDDPTLLFTNAGMNQFKPIFLGQEKREYTRAVNTQKCIRAGGKHNDLDDVGRSRRHHTFFEMLGNWSFGDYFKRGAIEMSWELLTKVWKLDPERLHVTCFEGDEKNGVPRDTEAANIWKEVAGLPDSHIHYFGKDNFWEMGDTGPCGPCTEIYYDRTPDKSGGPLVNGEDPRVMEIWNNVFIQYNRNADRTLVELPAQHVDTGMGFERITQVLQDVDSNYSIDLFNPFWAKLKELSGHTYGGKFPKTNSVDAAAEAADEGLRKDIAFRVIADHVRCLTFALTDGAVPSNEGRGYVLRRILRRAVRFGRQQLGLQEPFLHTLVPVVIDAMGDAFPELRGSVPPTTRAPASLSPVPGGEGQRERGFSNPNDADNRQAAEKPYPSPSIPLPLSTRGEGGNAARVAELIGEEEISFGKTLDRGLRLFNRAALAAVANQHRDEFPEHEAFELDVRIAFPETEIDEKYFEDYHVDLSKEQSAETVPSIDDNRLQHLIDSLRRKLKSRVKIAPADAFKLHDTYGFPIDLTRIMAEERGMTVDIAGYEKLMEQAKEIARAGGKDQSGKKLTELPPAILADLAKMGVAETDDSAKFSAEPISAKVMAIWNGTDLGSSPIEAGDDEQLAIILDRTNFYAEMGGQVGDAGTITAPTSLDLGETKHAAASIFDVDSTKVVGGFVLHIGRLRSGKIGVGEIVTATVKDERGDTEKNHTSTHLANWALRETLGDGVQQKGSLVDPDKLRFDFSHGKAMSDAEIEKVESLVNAAIAKNLPVSIEVMPQEQALKINGLRAVFGEKYPPKVRVVSVGASVAELLKDPGNAAWRNFSIEFCGGTHLTASGEAEGFAIVAEESVSKGIRRLTALTGDAAQTATTAGQGVTKSIELARLAPGETIAAAIAQIQQQIGDALMPLRTKRQALAAVVELQQKQKQFEKAQASVNNAIDIGVVAGALERQGETIVADVPGASDEQLRNIMNAIRKRRPSHAILLAAVTGAKVSFIAMVSDDRVAAGLSAGDWVREAAKVSGGGGGGKPQMAQAGGKDPAKLQSALDAARAFAAAKAGA